MKIPRVPLRSPRIEMLPLIDIVFLLLVFFIYAMLSMALHRGMPVILPVSSQSQVELESVLSVTLRADGRIFVDRAAVSLESLTGVLERRTMNSKEPGVLLFADGSVSYQQLFGVLDSIRKAGIARISLQSKTEGGV